MHFRNMIPGFSHLNCWMSHDLLSRREYGEVNLWSFAVVAVTKQKLPADKHESSIIRKAELALPK